MQNDKNSYGIPYFDIFNNLENMKVGKYHYNYKGIDFMLNYKTQSEKLLIVFHARVDIHDKIPVFHKNNYDKCNVSVLSLSDKLLEKYQHINSTLFADLPNEFYQNKYLEIIRFIMQLINAPKNIFYGSCSGGYAAINYGSRCNGIVICTNSYIYTNDFIDLYNRRAGFASNQFIMPNIEEIVQESPPKYMYIYVNKNDNYIYQQNVKFIKFCKNNIPDKFTYKIHESSNGILNCHLFYFPDGENFDSIFESI